MGVSVCLRPYVRALRERLQACEPTELAGKTSPKFLKKVKSMESLRELYRIGRGPSSSHTMGPSFAAQRFKEAHPEADGFRVTLYGSLAKTAGGCTAWAGEKLP